MTLGSRFSSTFEIKFRKNGPNFSGFSESTCVNTTLVLEFQPKYAKAIVHSSPRRLAGEKKSASYNHKTTIWVSHEYYLNSEFQKI